MTLQKIRIENIKGIGAKTFTLDVIPNKPSLLYAPNGFGKSSLAIAFQSLNNKRINLDEDNMHQGDKTRPPLLKIEFQKVDGTLLTVFADQATNTIDAELDTFVINNQVRAKGTKFKFAGRTNVSASLNIDPIILIDRIPAAGAFSYSIGNNRTAFGANGKILPNISTHLANAYWLNLFEKDYAILNRLEGIRVKEKITDFKIRINQQQGTTDNILAWMETNEVAFLNSIIPLNDLADALAPMTKDLTSRSELLLAAIQVAELYIHDKPKFKLACKRKIYELDKAAYNATFKAFNSTWKDIRPKEKDGSLMIEFPKAHHISNGQRDILSFVALLEKARRKLTGKTAILIIDEVFDYLDEANVVAAQYYVSEFINDFKSNGRVIYPLILTHLSPGFFRNYTFSKLRVYYLDQRTSTVSHQMTQLIEKRNDPSIETDVSQYLLHFHTGTISKRTEFLALGLRAVWGEANHFDLHIQAEIQKYLDDLPGFDPFAVCCSVRKKIESKIYGRLSDPTEQATFLATHGTAAKLEYAESVGAVVPEYYYLLGIIYNDGMHWKQGADNVSAISARLENGTIRKLIADVFK